MSRLRGAMAAYAIGFVVALVGLAIEAATSGSRPSALNAACYGLLGGLGASGAHALVAVWGQATTARLAALAAALPIIALQLGYALNVKLLPGEHFLSVKSLAADLLVVALMAALVFLAGASPLSRAARGALGSTTAWVGGAVLVASVLGLVVLRRRTEPTPLRTGSGPDLVLVVMDSVRRDRLGAYGHDRPTSPHFDALAAQGVVFEGAQAAAPWTLPSVRVLLRQDRQFDQGLAERLAARGYVTACFTDNPHLVRGSGILRGFDHVERSVGTWRTPIGGTLLSELVERLSPGDDMELVRRALRWVAGQRGPVFLYVHLMDAHTPYRFPEIDGRRRGGRRIEYPVSLMPLTAEEADGIRARYEGGIRSADAALGRLFDGLRHRPSVLAVVTADHGENLGESGLWFHGSDPTPERLAVPLLVVDSSRSGVRMSAPVGFATISTAILAASGDSAVAGTILDPAPTVDAMMLWQPALITSDERPGGALDQSRERLRALGYVVP